MKVTSLEQRAQKLGRIHGASILVFGILALTTAARLVEWLTRGGPPLGEKFVAAVGLTALSVFLIHRARRTERELDRMIANLHDTPYHEVTFDRASEAAAFVAALARQLHSPRSDFPDERDLVEVWAVADAAGARVFLSDLAFDATANAFAVPPAAKPFRRNQLPDDSVLLIAGALTKPLGLDDVQKLLTASR